MGLPPTTSNRKCCDNPPSKPATQTTSNIVSLRSSQDLGGSGVSIENL